MSAFFYLNSFWLVISVEVDVDMVTICGLCFIQFVVYSMRNLVMLLSDREESSVLLTI